MEKPISEAVNRLVELRLRCYEIEQALSQETDEKRLLSLRQEHVQAEMERHVVSQKLEAAIDARIAAALATFEKSFLKGLADSLKQK